ncbi:MAG: tetratricopeptide (TPR) repeat protein [Chlamydiales bacterium]|jgi:tetratricopeptide (TPR) repeat protein
MSEATASPVASGRRWLLGPLTDLIFGCGIGYGVFFMFQVFAGGTMRSIMPLALLPVLTLLVAGPHYGATLLRVFQRREDRQKYGVFAAYISIILGVAFVVGLRSAVVGSAVLTVYLTWSPWHYSGQNYGIALMFLGRRGVRITLPLKRLIYASFVCSYILLFFSMHGGSRTGDYAPISYGNSIYSFTQLGIPTGFSRAVVGIAAVGYLISILGAAFLLLRRASLRDVLPTFLLIALQGLWFTAPVLSRLSGILQGVDPLSVEHARYAFMWIAVGHSLQYLWITTYFAKQTGLTRLHSRFLARSLVVGTAVWILPIVLFSPGALGQLPKDMGLGIMTAAVVNLHHFLLDGAIWKLRDSRIARVLMKRGAEKDAQGTARSNPMPRWVSSTAWSLGVLVLFWGIGVRIVTYQFDMAVARKDLAGAAVHLERMDSLLVAGPTHHSTLSSLALDSGDHAQARAQAEMSLALYPTAKGWNIKGTVQGLTGDWAGACEALEAGVELDPQNVRALLQTAGAHMRAGQAERAVELLERALDLDPDNGPGHQKLGTADLGLNDLSAAREHLERAYELGQTEVLPNLGETLRRLGDMAGAVTAFKQSVLTGTTPQAVQRLAWILGTSSVDGLRDAREAVRLGQALNESSGFQNRLHLETLAAAHAADSDFEAAVRLQLDAIRRIDPAQRQQAEARLALYRDEQAIRE